MQLTPTIGLEIHVELKTKTKMFCGCLNDPDERHPNINVCPVCLGHPGVLPVINQEAIKSVLKVGMALDGKLAEKSHFDRKNYFYPDLPKGYQISQYKAPLCFEGYLETPNFGGDSEVQKSQFPISKFQTNSKQISNSKQIRIRRIHLEEDTGRLIHQGEESLVDFNRAGVPLMEIVTEPDITSGKDARDFCEELQLILRYLDVSNADMEKGQMRCEVNISLNMGTKVEIKNLNSFRSVERAIDYEIERQKEVLENGGKIEQETRGWDDAKQKTFSQRKKEEAHDYRYFPEPDLPPLKISNLKSLRRTNLRGRQISNLPELPQQKRERFKKEYGLKEPQIEILVRDKKLSDFFEEAVSELKDIGYPSGPEGYPISFMAKIVFNYLASDLSGLMNIKYLTWEELRVAPHAFGELISIIAKKEISSRVAKDVLKEMVETGKDAGVIVKEKKLEQRGDKEFIEEIVKKIIGENPQAASDYKKGKEEALQFLIGQAMRQTKGKTNPEVLKECLISLLKNI
jgi:aspartyl-tRNA(Asn)/glutamyl-tRNA(Gln) amidotransferase subunit B